MKGLHGGIPLAVLAATARAHVQVRGGPSGADVGDHASIPTKNTATSTVNEDFKDDHSFELEHEVKVYPPGHGHHKRFAGGPDTSGIGGPSGDDIGNVFAAATVNTLSSEVNEAYKDDHSVDIDKTTIIKPHDHHRRGDNFPEVPVRPTVIGSQSRDDIGNVADIPTLNDFSSSVTESYVDNHSVDVDKNTIAKPHWRRQHSVVDGPGGDDIGNVADIPTLNELSSSVTESSVDNHSVDVDKNTIVKPHWRRRHSVFDGPGGDDVGSAAFFADVNEFSSSFTGKYKDDHSVDIDKTTIVKPGTHHGQEHGNSGFHHPPNKHEARGYPATVIGGPSGDDIGNVADIPTINSVTSTFDAQYADDHSVDVDKTFIKPHRARALRPGHEDWDGKDSEEGTTVVGRPSGDDIGNGIAAASVNTVDTETNESVDDDHSVKVDETEIIDHGDDHIHPIHPHPEGHGTEQPVVHSGAQEHSPSAPVQHDSKSESDPDCTKVHQMVQTVTSTHTAVEIATHTVWPQPAHSEAQQSSYDEYPAAVTPSGPHGQEHGQEQGPATPQYGSEHDSSNHNDSGAGSSWSSQAPEQTSNSGYTKGQQEAPAAPQYQGEHDSGNSDPEAGSSWSNPQASEESNESGYGQEQAPATPQYGSENDSSNHNDSGAGSSGSNPQASEESNESGYGQEQAPATPQYGSGNDGSNHNDSGAGSSWSSQAPEQTSNSGYTKGQQEAPAAPQYQEEHDSSNSDPEAGSDWSNSQLPAQPSNSQSSGQSGTSSEHQSPSQDQDQGQDKSSDEWSSPSSSNEEESYQVSPAPAASEVYYGAQSSHAAWESTPTSASHASHAYSHIQHQPSPTSQGAYHTPAASAITVAEASTFSVIPVFVPSGTPRAHAHVPVVVASSSSPVSPAFRVHSAAVPSGVSAEQNHRHSPSPSTLPSTNGVVEFTGGAGRFAKMEGVCGVLVGAFTLLAFVL
ncbi:hypothetical protein BDV11DRAFT_108155 [Aspergillus similis]